MLMLLLGFFFFFKQKTAYEIRIRDWSSDVCSSDLFPSHDRDYILSGRISKRVWSSGGGGRFRFMLLRRNLKERMGMEFSIIEVIAGETTFNYWFSVVFWIGFLAWSFGLLLRILNRS